MTKPITSSEKDIIIIFVLAVFVFIISNLCDFFHLILAFISGHESLQLDDLIVLSIFLVFALIFFSYRRSREMEQEIHERMKVEGALLKANHKLNLLFGITRHDINNQLTILIGYLAVLRESGDDPRFVEYVQKAVSAADRIAVMIRFTKEYEKIGLTAPAWQNVRLLVDNATKEAITGNILVKNDIPANMSIFADPLIVRVFYNLIDNAVRYGGKITSIRFSMQELAGHHIMVCEDDGAGVPDDEKEKIFERGYGKNTGLGLALSQEIVGITDISIRETGKPGNGARFEMEVPEEYLREEG